MSDVTFVIVQHGEKQSGITDPGLTETGQRQATACAGALARSPVVAVYSSPLRRAVETAAPICLTVEMHVTLDRDYEPKFGDSSKRAGGRFEAALRRYADVHPSGVVVCASHGGVTVDLLRDLLGDDELARRAPTVMTNGMPGGALTTICLATDAWSVVEIAAIGHVPEADQSGHHA